MAHAKLEGGLAEPTTVWTPAQRAAKRRNAKRRRRRLTRIENESIRRDMDAVGC